MGFGKIQILQVALIMLMANQASSPDSLPLFPKTSAAFAVTLLYLYYVVIGLYIHVICLLCFV